MIINGISCYELLILCRLITYLCMISDSREWHIRIYADFFTFWWYRQIFSVIPQLPNWYFFIYFLCTHLYTLNSYFHAKDLRFEIFPSVLRNVSSISPIFTSKRYVSEVQYRPRWSFSSQPKSDKIDWTSWRISVWKVINDTLIYVYSPTILVRPKWSKYRFVVNIMSIVHGWIYLDERKWEWNLLQSWNLFCPESLPLEK